MSHATNLSPADRSRTTQTTLSTALVAMSLVTLLVAGGLQLLARYRSEREAAGAREALTARDAARQVSAFVTDKLGILEAAAWVADPESLAPADRRTLLQSLVGLQPAFVRLVLAGPDDSILADVSRVPGGAAETRQDLGAALASSHAERWQVGPVLIDPSTNEPRVILAVPVLNAERQRRGALLAEVNLKFMWEVVQGLENGASGYAFVVDRSGRLLAFGDSARVLRGESVSALRPVATFLRAPGGAPVADGTSYSGILGSRVVGGYAPVGTPDWAVVTELPWREAYAGTLRDSAIAVMILALMTVGAGLLGAVLARRLAHPLESLVETTNRVAAGERGVAAPAGGPREVRALAVAFNSMTRRLEASLDDLHRQVTEVRRAEEALRESEERFRLVLDATNAGIWDWSVPTDTYYFSPTFYTMLGYEPGEFPAHADHLVPLLHEDDADRAVAVIREAVTRSEPFVLEFRARAKSGLWHWIRSSGRAVAWDSTGRATRIVGAHADVTASREAEAALRANEYFLAKSQEAGGLGSYNFDLRTVAWKCTPKLVEILGIGPDHPRTADGWLALIHPDDLEELKGHLLEEVLARRQRFDREYRIVRPDGQVRWVHGLGELEFDGTGRPVEMFGTIQDVTARREAEAEIRRLNEDLEARVLLRTEQLEAANRELEAFAYSVSHDLRAPLRAIDGYTGILLEDHGERLDESGRRVCGVVRDETQRMARLIDDLLEFSRYGRTSLNRLPLDMAPIVRAVFCDVTTEESRQRIDMRLGGLPSAPGDPALVRQVWTNLVSNAVKFSSKRDRAVIEIAGVEEPRRVVYTVRDNGAGFDMRFAEKLFGVFQRLHSTREFEGTGVGLAIVQRIVHRHGGDVWADARPGEGATFHFSLPRVNE